MRSRLRQIVAGHAGVEMSGLRDDADLWRAGMTSKAAVRVMLEIEDEFDVEFPAEGLSHAGFGSIDAIAAAVERLHSAEEVSRA